MRRKAVDVKLTVLNNFLFLVSMDPDDDALVPTVFCLLINLCIIQEYLVHFVRDS